MTDRSEITRLENEAREERRETRQLQRREAELEAKIDSRKTTSELQTEVLRAPRTERDDDSKSESVSDRQANALRRSSGD